MKHITKKLAVLLALLLLCAGCGDKEDKENETTAADETTSASESVAAPDTVIDETATELQKSVSFTALGTVTGVESEIYFPADMTFEATDYLYASSPKEGYYITAGALAAGKDVHSAYLWLKDGDKKLEFEMDGNGTCKGVTGWTGLPYDTAANGIYFVFDNTGSAAMWTLTKPDGTWQLNGTGITAPEGYYAAYADEGAQNCGNWFVVFRHCDGGSDIAVGTFDFGKTLVQADLSAQIAEHGDARIIDIRGSNSLEYIIEAEFADGTKLNLVGAVDKNGQELEEKMWSDSGKNAPVMFSDASTIPAILG